MSGKSKTLAMLPFFPRDYISATRHFSVVERGVYSDMLFFSWDMGPLPNDSARLAALVGLPKKDFEKAWRTVRSKFVETEAGLINERLEQERHNSLQLRQKASEKAATAAAARWSKALADARSNAPSNAPSNARSNAPSIETRMPGAMLEDCPPAPSPSPSTQNSEDTAPRKRARPAIPTGPRARSGVIVESEEVQRRRRDAAALVAGVNGAEVKSA